MLKTSECHGSPKPSSICHQPKLSMVLLLTAQDLHVHQTETGRPVTDAVVQEVCKLRPEMIGLSLRDCIEVMIL